MIRLFKVSIPSSAVALIISEALLLFACYLFAAYLTVNVPLDTFLFTQGGYWQIAFVMAVIMLGLYFHDLYRNYRVRSRIQLIQQFCLVLGLAFLLQSLLSYAQWEILLPKWMMVYGSLFVLILLPAWRMIFTSLSMGGQKLLFLGSSRATREIAAILEERPEIGLTAVGYLENRQDPLLEEANTPRLGSIVDLDDVVAVQQPNRVVVGTMPREMLPVQRLLEFRLAGVQIEEASDTYEAVFGRVSAHDLPPSQLIFSNEMSPRRTSVALQSAYSLLVALIGLVFALPVMVIVAIIVKFTSSGSVIYRQQSAGLHGKQFSVLRFRSSGEWLHRFRLNELPQLFNVLRGEMAIVGPRPERPEFASLLEERIPYYRQRLCVKPGVTGWAQINQRGSKAIEDSIEKLEYDRYYIKNLSLSLDAYIIMNTLKATLFGG